MLSLEIITYLFTIFGTNAKWNYYIIKQFDPSVCRYKLLLIFIYVFTELNESI